MRIPVKPDLPEYSAVGDACSPADWNSEMVSMVGLQIAESRRAAVEGRDGDGVALAGSGHRLCWCGASVDDDVVRAGGGHDSLHRSETS